MEMYIMNKYSEVMIHLNQLGSDYSKAWDVPYELCEAGITESLGVKISSRGYINKILNELQDDGLIFFEKKHIIGVGTCRRKAYFLTTLGKDKIKEEINNE
jgi:DNA-binding PadR family transcriptional regulator